MASGDVVASIFRGGEWRMGGGEASLCVCGAEMTIRKSRVELWFGLWWGARSEGGIIKKLGMCCFVF